MAPVSISLAHCAYVAAVRRIEPVHVPILGDLSEGVPPVPIPNTEVKPFSPDCTARASVWETRKSPGYINKKPDPLVGLFCVYASPFTSPNLRLH